MIKVIQRLFTSSRDGFFAKSHPGKYLLEAKDILSSTSDRRPISIYKEFLFYETIRAGKCIPCEQTPRYLFYLDEILKFFPHARIINIVRDPRDVLISQKNKWRRRFFGASNIPWLEAIRAKINYHPYLIARLWVCCVRQAQRFSNHPQVISIKFEDLLSMPEQTVRLITNFIGIPFDPAMLDIPQIGSSSGQDRPHIHGINKYRAHAWQRGGLNRSELIICEWVAGKEMVKYQYKPSGNGKFSLVVLHKLLILLPHLALVLIFNAFRNRNLVTTIRRRLVC